MTGPKKSFKTSYTAVLTYLFKVQNVVKRSVKSRIHFSTSYRGGGVRGCGVRKGDVPFCSQVDGPINVGAYNRKFTVFHTLYMHHCRYSVYFAELTCHEACNTSVEAPAVQTCPDGS